MVRVDEDAADELRGLAVKEAVPVVEGPDDDRPMVGVAAVGPPAVQVLVLSARPDEQTVFPEMRPRLFLRLGGPVTW